jgi:hypothetical protein
VAKILENNDGRRMIRLSPQDVLNVVTVYQKRLHNAQTQSVQAVEAQLIESPCYLPEEP